MNSMMKPFGRNRVVMLKTYGKQMRKVDAWFSPDTRKTVFSSSSSSDLSIGAEENCTVNPGRVRQRKQTTARPKRNAKKRALTSLKDSEEEEEDSIFSVGKENKSDATARKDTVNRLIIPIEGEQTVNGEMQKKFDEILHEVIISNLHCAKGSYPKPLLKAWDKFDKQRNSENDRPDFFEEDQLFLILEFEFGGSDLENMQKKLPSLATAKSILHQVTASLAVAEQALCFEHRDLHWGNILVKKTNVKEGKYTINGTTYNVMTNGVHVNIIDYSLSRLEIDGLTVSCDISTDEGLFMGQGDYQFEIYRKMREENHNSWSEYNPHTNVLWLHYLTDKLLKMSYKTIPRSHALKETKKNIEQFYRELLQYESATQVLQSCSLFQ
ncbi:UNVERIFIED_CONTAM: hypothetical protein FKN15_018371 [Acipenser sinensis]